MLGDAPLVDTSDKDFEDLISAVRRDTGSKLFARMLRDAANSPLRRSRLEVLVAALPTGTDARRELEEFSRPETTVGKVVHLQDARAASLPDTSGGFQDVGGLEHVKKQLRRKLIDPQQHQGIFARFGRRSGGGVLLYGPPGCGKTMIVKAAAVEAKARIVSVEVAQILVNSIGGSEKLIANAFDEARDIKPCILFFDEVEALAGRRGRGTPLQASIVSTFLTAFDGMAEHNDGIFVAAATNTPWAVDTAFRRPGRFDRTLFVPPPDRDARRSILASLLAGLPIGETLDIDQLVERTSWYSGADLRALVESAVDDAIEASLKAGEEVPLRQAHLTDALDDVRPSTREWLATARNYAKYANDGGIYDEMLEFLNKHGQ